MFLKISHYSQESTCAGVSFLINLQALAKILKKFLGECCEIFKNTYFKGHFQMAASAIVDQLSFIWLIEKYEEKISKEKKYHYV